MADKKKPTLSGIVEDLSPKKIEAIERKHAEARNKYQLKNIEVGNWADFRKELTSYMKHHHKYTLLGGKAGPELSDESALSEGLNILEAAYEKEGGQKYAYNIARKGKLNDILNAIASVKSQQEMTDYEKFVKSKIDPQDRELHKAFAKEFRSKYKEFIPKGMKTKSDEELAMHYNQLITHHLEHQQKIENYFKPYEAEKKKEEKKKTA